MKSYKMTTPFFIILFLFKKLIKLNDSIKKNGFQKLPDKAFIIIRVEWRTKSSSTDSTFKVIIFINFIKHLESPSLLNCFLCLISALKLIVYTYLLHSKKQTKSLFYFFGNFSTNYNCMVYHRTVIV